MFGQKVQGNERDRIVEDGKKTGGRKDGNQGQQEVTTVVALQKLSIAIFPSSLNPKP
jgi:hypothetical protein